MTQEEPVEQPKHSPQRYQRIASYTFGTYAEAKGVAITNFAKLLSNLGKTPSGSDLTSEDYKVRVKRRDRNGREHFDVVCYASLDLFKNVEKKLEEAQTEATPAVEQPKEKAKDRRAREQKKS